MMPDTYIHIPKTDNYWKLEKKYRENAAINQFIDQTANLWINIFTTRLSTYNGHKPYKKYNLQY
jgi:hypothetical protein